MEKIKGVLSPGQSKDDEVMYDTSSKDETAGPTGKVTGQGSHFGSKELPETEMSTTAPDVSTTSPMTTTTESATDPTTERVTDSSSQAAVGETSTYSSQPLATGDPTSSVVDPNSSDPTTFKKPETSTSGQDIGMAGVGSGAALAAASAAFKKDKDPESGNVPGSYPSSAANPYANTNIDPRVDSLASREATGTRDAAATGTAGAAASEVQTSSAPTTTATPATETAAEPEKEKTSLKTKVFGALGIGAAGAAAKERKASASSAVGSSAAPGSGPPPSHHRKESIPTTAYPSGTFDSPRATAPPVGGTTGQSDTIDQHADKPYSSREAAGTSGKRISVGGQGGAGPMAAAAAAVGGAGLAAPRFEPGKPTDQFFDKPYSSRDPGIASQKRISVSGQGGVLPGTDVRPGSVPDTAVAHQNIPPAVLDTGGRHGSAREIEDQARRDSQRVQAAGAYSGGYAAFEGRDRSEARRASQQNAEQHSHLGRDTAVGASGLGAAGLAAHEYEKKHETDTVGSAPTTNLAESRAAEPAVAPTTHDLTTTSQVPTADAAATQPTDESYLGRDAATAQPTDESYLGRDAATAQPTDESYLGRDAATTQPTDESHLGRDAAIGGAAGLGAGALAEHEGSKHEAEKAEKQRQEAEAMAAKQREKDLKAQAKEEKKAAKEEAKEERKEQKAAEKEAKREEKEKRKEEEAAAAAAAAETAKQREKERKDEEIAAGIEQRRQDYEARKAEVKQDQDQRIAARIAEEEEKRKHEKEGIVAAGAGSAAVASGAYAVDKLHDKDTEPGSEATETTAATTEATPATGTVAEGAGSAAVPSGAYAVDKLHDKDTEPGLEATEPTAATSEATPATGTVAGGAGSAAVPSGAYAVDKLHDKNAEPGLETTETTAATSEATPATGTGVVDEATTTPSHHGAEETAAAVGVGGLAAHEMGKHDEEAPLTSNEPWKSGESTTGTSAAAVYDAEKHGEEEPVRDHHLATDAGGEDGTGGAFGGLAAADAADRAAYGKKEPHEKKPGFFRRIFKRRKNKDTGESEDYSSEEEHEPTDSTGQTSGRAPATDSAGYSLGTGPAQE